MGLAHVAPILAGLAIMAAVLVPWSYVAELNRTVRPDLPWAAVATCAYMAIGIAWLHGLGWPKATSHTRRRLLRLWPPSPAAEGSAAVTGGLVLAFVVLTAVWIAMTRLSPLPDLSAYPTTSYRWSMFLMGGIISGVVEEAAYRGYMQSGLERINPSNAIAITSVVFTLSHITHGIGTLVVMAPGLFIASVLYGVLAQRTGSILPGMLIHTLGDLSRTFFGVLRGDGSLLFVS